MAACAAACLPRFMCGDSLSVYYMWENRVADCLLTPASYLCLNVCGPLGG
jgi:hypothetical protein